MFLEWLVLILVTAEKTGRWHGCGIRGHPFFDAPVFYRSRLAPYLQFNFTGPQKKWAVSQPGTGLCWGRCVPTVRRLAQGRTADLEITVAGLHAADSSTHQPETFRANPTPT